MNFNSAPSVDIRFVCVRPTRVALAMYTWSAVIFRALTSFGRLLGVVDVLSPSLKGVCWSPHRSAEADDLYRDRHPLCQGTATEKETGSEHDGGQAHRSRGKLVEIFASRCWHNASQLSQPGVPRHGSRASSYGIGVGLFPTRLRPATTAAPARPGAPCAIGRPRPSVALLPLP